MIRQEAGNKRFIRKNKRRRAFLKLQKRKKKGPSSDMLLCKRTKHNQEGQNEV
jgi:hypothetical protein